MSTDAERQVLDLLRDPAATPATARASLAAWPAAHPVQLAEDWATLARDEAAAPWRRLLAAQVILGRHVRYPLTFAAFVAEALRPLGADETRLTDMSMAQMVPVDRAPADGVLMAPLPITTAVGPAAIYLAVRLPDRRVLEAAVAPDPATLASA